MNINKWEYFEPLKTNRWIIKLKGCDIEEYLFRKYKIFNDGNKLMFSTEVYETVHHHINPKDLFNIEELTDRKSTRLNSSHCTVRAISRMPSSA
jgi:hypothetical protein